MNDLDTLRPEVREALDWFVARRHFGTNGDGHLKTIRAELLRLARENDEWQMRCLQFQTERDHARQMHADRDVDVQHEWARAEAAEAELAALKAKIGASPTAYLTSRTGIGPCNIASMAHGAVFDANSYGKTVRLLVEE